MLTPIQSYVWWASDYDWIRQNTFFFFLCYSVFLSQLVRRLRSSPLISNSLHLSLQKHLSNSLSAEKSLIKDFQEFDFESIFVNGLQALGNKAFLRQWHQGHQPSLQDGCVRRRFNLQRLKKQKLRTPVNKDGDTNPKWNYSRTASNSRSISPPTAPSATRRSVIKAMISVKELLQNFRENYMRDSRRRSEMATDSQKIVI